MIEVKTYKVGKLKTNCYLITDPVTKRGVIIDPGGEIPDFTKEVSLFKIDYILLTHGHFDHILNANKYKKLTQSKIVISKLDSEFTSNNNLNLSRKFLRPNTFEQFKPDILINDNDTITFSDTKITVLATPGHTQGSVCYMLGNYIFSGDTLFFRDHGYTKFPTGSSPDMEKSLNRLYTLKGDYIVYPGHSKITLLSEERNNSTGLKKQV